MKESKTDKVIQAGQLLANHSQAYTLYDANGLCPTIASGQKRFGGLPTWIKYETNMAEHNAIELPSELRGKKFRIRKLTPRECFRLMGVDDKDIDKIQAAGVSNSAQYKLAGNSIVVDVLFHIFRKMFIDPDTPDNDGKPQQLSLW